MIERHHLFIGPMQVITDIGYLLEQGFRGVANYPPRPFTSTSKLPSQCGQVTGTRLLPVSLMRR